MKQRKLRLRQEIVLLVVIKLVAIAALWWYFVRDAHIAVTPTSTAEHLGATQRNPTLSGETHDQ